MGLFIEDGDGERIDEQLRLGFDHVPIELRRLHNATTFYVGNSANAAFTRILMTISGLYSILIR